MNTHDTRGEYDRIAKFLEANDVEVDWEALMKSEWWVGPPDWEPPPKWSMPQPYPRPLTQQMVTNLLLARENEGLEIPRLLAPGGEGVELAEGAAVATGHIAWEKFLTTLSNLQITTVTLTLVTREERRALVKMAMLEEEISKRERERNVERVMRQGRGEARVRVKRRSVKRLVRGAMVGNREAIRELERRGIVSGEELERWKGISERKGERMRKMNEEENLKKKKRASLFWPEGGSVKKKKEEEQWVPGEVELEVMRVGPNPRILTCRYERRGEERTCLVRVKSNRTFKRGMKIRMEEPKEMNGEPWEYGGVLPRYEGRW
jgi:hypothetical protein